jgi:regulator of telomere elongation helicase 1
VNYIEKVTSALLKSQNALLESPTGTGKTLCLLCGTLAWQVQNKTRMSKTQGGQQVPLQYSDGPTAIAAAAAGMGAGGAGAAKPSVIVYASRTHAQLAQVVSELRASGYTPRMSVLGSREQLCIHSRISKLRGSALNHACNTTCGSRGCTYKNNLESYTASAEGTGSAPSPILDIEQLNEMGRRDQICPYFFSRDSSTNADIVLLPYNYLVDSSIRATLKVAWENAIVIFDEAHNLESVATDATSFSISSNDIAACIAEMQQVVRALQVQAMESKGGGPASDEGPGTGGGGGGKQQPPNVDRCIQVLTHMFELERRLDGVPLSAIANMGQAVGKVFPGKWLLEVMEQSGFRVELVC